MKKNTSMYTLFQKEINFPLEQKVSTRNKPVVKVFDWGLKIAACLLRTKVYQEILKFLILIQTLIWMDGWMDGGAEHSHFYSKFDNNLLKPVWMRIFWTTFFWMDLRILHSPHEVHHFAWMHPQNDKPASNHNKQHQAVLFVCGVQFWGKGGLSIC